MPYISLLNYWKNHDIEGVTNMVDDKVAAYYVNEIGEPVALNKSLLIDMLHKRMKQVELDENLQWNFEVIHRAQVYDKQTVIFCAYAYENSNYHDTKKTLIAVTFSARKPNTMGPIKAIYITPNVKDYHN